MKSAHARFAGVGVVTLALTGAVIAPAQAASVPERLSMSASFTPAASAAVAPDVEAAGVSCKVNHIVYNRYESCAVGDVTLTLLRNGRPVGSAKFKITNHMTLQNKKVKWSETTSVSKATLVNASGIRVSLGVKCGGKCTAKSKFPGGTLGGSAINGKVDYSSSVAKQKQDTTTAQYTFTFTKAGYTPATVRYGSLRMRCDDTFWNRANTARTLSPGCVHPAFTPTMTTMATLPEIARNIRDVQSRGRHLGVPGGAVIRREAREANITANRNAVCPRGQVPPRPGLSCDEYPFASTLEGGHHVPPSSRGTRWVPASEQNKQGGRIQTFHKKERVVHGDGFWVKV